MGTVELFFLGLGLSMDAAAVSISNTLAYPHLKWKAKLSMPLLFALFQGIMPILGYYASGIFATFIDTYAGFVTFFILCFIGGKMILEAVKEWNEEDIVEVKDQPLDHRNMFVLAVATSIDALAVGITFAFLDTPILEAITIIGITTMIISIVGVVIGNYFGGKYKHKAELVGGIILVLLGVRILIQHLSGLA